MQAMKESASNIAASAKAGMEKTKATMQEKVEKMSSHDPAQKEMATEMKEDRMAQAELNKQEAKDHNAAAKQAASAAGGQGRYATSGTGGYQSSDPESQIYSAAGLNDQQYSGVAEQGGLWTQPSGLPGDGAGYGSGTRGNAPGSGAGRNSPAWPDDSTFN